LQKRRGTRKGTEGVEYRKGMDMKRGRKRKELKGRQEGSKKGERWKEEVGEGKKKGIGQGL